MSRLLPTLTLVAAATAALSAHAMPGETGIGPVASPPETVGPTPVIKPVDKHLIPTVQVAKAVGWSAGGKPAAAPGIAVNAFASGLNHPRWLYVLPNGDVLVAETNAPPKPDDSKGIKGKVMGAVQKKAGAAAPTANRIVLLRDADGDGIAETRTVFIDALNSPFGMALVGNDLYVADTDEVLKFTYKPGATSIAEPGVKVTDLPAGTINHHWTKNIIASADGARLYATTGSNSNAGDNGIEAEAGRAAIYEIDRASGTKRLFATGLRNPNGMAWASDGRLWTVVNERDELGSDLVPDYLTSVEDSDFFGWPWRYWGNHVDARVKAPAPDYVVNTRAPDYALGAHTASLGLTFSTGQKLGPDYAEGAFIGQHGSWNRNPPSGYKVVYVPFSAGRPTGAKPQTILDGFLVDGKAHGRPVGVAIDARGDLLVADDVGNVVWRVRPAGGEAPTRMAAAVPQRLAGW